MNSHGQTTASPSLGQALPEQVAVAVVGGLASAAVAAVAAVAVQPGCLRGAGDE